MRRGPAQDASTAIRFPSAENVGLNAFSTSLLSLPEVTSSIQTAPSWNAPKTSPGGNFTPGCRARTNATCFSSGDQVGWISSKSPCDNCKSCPEGRFLRKILRILPTSPAYKRSLPLGDHAGYSSTPSAKVTWESVVCKAGPELFHRIAMTNKKAMRAMLQITAGTHPRDRRFCLGWGGAPWICTEP